MRSESEFLRSKSGIPQGKVICEVKKQFTFDEVEKLLRDYLQQQNARASPEPIALAIAQFTGWQQAISNGDRVIDLVESMGLTKSEWDEIKPQVQWLNKRHIVEIDNFFDNL